MKIATMSKVFRVLGRIPPAMRSERKTSPLLSDVAAIEWFLQQKNWLCELLLRSTTYNRDSENQKKTGDYL